MDITQLYVSQRNLRRAAQIPSLITAIRNGEYIPPIRLSEAEDGTIQVDDGHHQVVAYWLCGRTYLAPHEYVVTLTDRPRPRFGHIPDLLHRCKLSAQSDIAILRDL